MSNDLSGLQMLRSDEVDWQSSVSISSIASMAHVATNVSHGLLDRCSEVRLGGSADDHVVLVNAVDVHHAGCLAGLQGHLLNARLRNVSVKV